LPTSFLPLGRWLLAFPVIARVPSSSNWPSASPPAMADNQVLVAEAGTGTGKTYAYLVPALLSGAR
jgi:ATP-dependent DNA helicase DinG